MDIEKAGLDEVVRILKECNLRLADWLERSRTLAVPDLLRQYWAIGEKYEKLDIERKAMNAMLEAISRHTVPEILETEGVKTISLEDIRRRFTVSTRFNCTMLDADAGKAWLRANGHEAIITETVNSSTLSAFAKSQIQEQGNELPAEIFKQSLMRYTSVTKIS